MDKYPVLAGGETVGELTVEAAASDTVLDMSCVRREGLWCAWAVGESGALRIGIPEPEGDRLHLRRRFSRSMTAPIGRILRGELRMPERAMPQWLPVDPAAPPVRSERFLRALQARQGVLTCRVDGRLLLADGKRRKAARPKAKKLRHVRLLHQEFDHPVIQKLQQGKPASDRELRQALAAFKGGITFG